MLTLIFFVLGISVALFSRREIVFSVLLASLIIYPEYDRVGVFLVQLSLARIIALIAVFRFSSGNQSRGILGYLVFSVWAVQLFASIIVGADEKHIVYVIGRFLDTVLFFMAGKRLISANIDVDKLVQFSSLVVVISVALAVIESATNYSLYTTIRAQSWMWNVKDYETRLGFSRAYGATLNPIYWGLTMFMSSFLLVSLYQLGSSRYFSAVMAVSTLGVFSSLSSGPILASFVFILMFYVVKTPAALKRLLMFFLFFAIFVEVFSNRHFYDLSQYFAINSDTAWYRSKLLSVAFDNYKSFILFGVGGKFPNHWGALIDGREIVDVVNQFLLIALNGGIVMLICYLLMMARPIVFFLKIGDRSISNFNFFRVAAIGFFSLCVSGMTVGFFNPVENLIYLVLGVFSAVVINSELALKGCVEDGK